MQAKSNERTIYSQKGYDYCDIDLVSSEISTITTRNALSTRRYSYELGPCPLIPSPMIDVVDKNTAQIIRSAGSTAIIHRFQTISQQKSMSRQYSGNYSCIGISDEDVIKFLELKNVGVESFCIDVANGANESVVKFCQKIESLADRKYDHKYAIFSSKMRKIDLGPRLNLMVGNVQTYAQYKYLAENIESLKSVRVGVAGGNGCSTKNATGIYSPQVTTLLDFRNKPRINDVKIIADGGIREPQDYCKAIALGADYVMAGSIFAACVDSPAKKFKRGGKTYVKFSGSSSAEVQEKYRAPKYIEGKTIEVPCNGLTIEELFKKYDEGLRSCMSYFNAHNLDEFQQKARWIYRK